MSSVAAQDFETDAPTGAWSTYLDRDHALPDAGATGTSRSPYMRAVGSSQIGNVDDDSTRTEYGLKVLTFATEISNRTTLKDWSEVARVQQFVDDALSEIRDGSEDEGPYFERLRIAVVLYRELALEAVRQWLIRHWERQDAVAAVLSWLGNIEDPSTVRMRVDLVGEMIRHESAIVRDAAALALEDLNDPRAIVYLGKALEVERYDTLRREYASIIASLGR